MADGPVQFIWVQLFLWSLLVSPALIKVSAALPAPIDGPLAAEEGAAATPSPGPGLGTVGALITIPRSCRVLQRDPPRASTQGHVARPGKAFRAPPRAAASPPSAHVAEPQDRALSQAGQKPAPGPSGAADCFVQHPSVGLRCLLHHGKCKAALAHGDLCMGWALNFFLQWFGVASCGRLVVGKGERRLSCHLATTECSFQTRSNPSPCSKYPWSWQQQQDVGIDTKTVWEGFSS